MPKHRHPGMAEFDHPMSEIIESVRAHADQGHECFQKFTCANCGQRLTMDVPNKIYTTGQCDKCGHVTDITVSGCNYLLIVKNAAL